MIEIRVTSSKQNYEFSIYQKITVIRGKSGTGKSQFFRLISDAWSEDVHIRISDGYELSALNGRERWKDIIEMSLIKGRKSIFVIDDEDFISTKEFADILGQDGQNYYILINRIENIGKLGMISFSAKEIYEMVGDGKEHYLQKFLHFGTTIPSGRYLCITEDAESGNDFFKLIFGQDNTASAGGKDQLLQYIMNNKSKYQGKQVFLALDLCASGNCIEVLLAYLQTCNISAFIHREYESFEYFLLKSHFYDYDFSNISNEEITSYLSFERMCTAILNDLSRGKLYHYTKEKLNYCYVKNCCFRQRRKACDRGIQGEKITEMLRGTIWEAFLQLWIE